MKNLGMPENREYVVVTRARLPHSQKHITHVYGPYGQSKAKSVKSNIKSNYIGGGSGDIEVSVCHVLDPESWRSSSEEDQALDSVPVQQDHREAGPGGSTSPEAAVVLDQGGS
jgi:hypothetical protein